MKKSLIAGASLALAAMPMAGVFAVANSTVTDNIVVTIAKECAITTNTTDSTQGIGDGTHTERTFSVSMQDGELKTLGGSGNVGAQDSATSVVNVVCNDSGTSGTDTSWQLTLIGGDGTSANANNKLVSDGNGTDIETGTGTSGASSSWAMKLDLAQNLPDTGGFAASFKEVPTTTAVVTKGNGSKSGAFTPSYQVYIGTAQEADTYRGKVTYTLTNPEP